jgi:hypothetical protein
MKFGIQYDDVLFDINDSFYQIAVHFFGHFVEFGECYLGEGFQLGFAGLELVGSQGGDDFGAEGFDAQAGFGAVAVYDDAGASGQGSFGDFDFGAGFEVFEFDFFGLVEQVADGLDFFVADFSGFAQVEYASRDAGVFEDGDAPDFVDVGEDVAGEQGFGDFFPPVAPFDFGAVGGAVDFVALFGQAAGDFDFVPWPGVEGAPDEGRVFNSEWDIDAGIRVIASFVPGFEVSGCVTEYFYISMICVFINRLLSHFHQFSGNFFGEYIVCTNVASLSGYVFNDNDSLASL